MKGCKKQNSINEPIKEMAVPMVDLYSGGIQFRLFVNTDDTDHEPHFHVQQGEYGENGKWKTVSETRIRLDEASYYSGGTKDVKLDDRLLAMIDDELRLMHSGINMTNWEYACYIWNESYNNTKFEPLAQQPDYTSM